MINGHFIVLIRKRSRINVSRVASNSVRIIYVIILKKIKMFNEIIACLFLNKKQYVYVSKI